MPGTAAARGGHRRTGLRQQGGPASGGAWAGCGDQDDDRQGRVCLRRTGDTASRTRHGCGSSAAWEYRQAGGTVPEALGLCLHLEWSLHALAGYVCGSQAPTPGS